MFHETETLELKRSTSELKEAVISIGAILNKHQGGELYFGIKNNGDVVGQDVSEKTLREISQAIAQHIEPKIYPQVERAAINGKQCIKVGFAGTDFPYFAYGRVYKRVSDEDRQLSAKEIENMILDKNHDKLGWDDKICKKAGSRDLDDKTIKQFIRLAKKSGRLPISKDSKKILLEKLLLLEGDKVNNAAVVSFGKTPDHFFPNVLIRCGRFKGDTKFIDMRDISGNLFSATEQVMRFFREHLSIGAEIKGLLREETWEIPLEALREAVLNALIHRDYKENSFVYIKIYDERIVITNPGNLPKGLAIKDLLRPHQSRLRNPLIARVFYYAGFIDAWGHGILNIVNLLKQQGLSMPVFEELKDGFYVTFKRPQRTGSEKSAEKDTEKSAEKTHDKILTLIKQKPEITGKEIAGTLKISPRTVDKNIAKLKSKGLLKRIGGDKGGHWKA